MKRVTIMAQVDESLCVGCRACEKVCPVYSIHVVDKKAKVTEADCRGCANCADRCAFRAITMVKRAEPFTVGVDVSKFDQEQIRELCLKAHFNPEQILCYCTTVRAEEVAAAILDGADTPEKISSQTGIRTGCTIECIQPILRLLTAAGHELKPDPKGWQWYGETVTAWTIPENVKEKYNSRGFYFEEDRQLLDEIANTAVENCSEGGC